jgi:hypothetical protein
MSDSTATIFVGIVGLVFTGTQIWMTHAKDDFDRKSKKLDVTMNLMPKCSSTEPSDWNYVNQFIGSQSVFPIQSMTRYFADDKFDQFLNKCSSMVHDAAATTPPNVTVPIPKKLPETATGNTTPLVSAPPGPSTPSTPPNEGDRFWIYLGTLKSNGWETRYLNIPNDFDPAKFNPTTDKNQGQYEVGPNSPLNVRYGAFSPTGSFPPITKALQPGTPVKLRSTAQWFDSGNWWATIEPPG